MLKHYRLQLFLTILILLLACNLPAGGGPAPSTTEPPLATDPPAVESEVAPTATSSVLHVQTPSTSVVVGSFTYDVDSSVTAPEKRAPYGDSYQINRLERPFLQDMAYVPDLDIVTFSLTDDATWYYVSVDILGIDPNNPLGIHYGVELDLDKDGFGEYIITAAGPFTQEWTTDGVKVFADRNHNTAGLSANKSDAPFQADGYETLIFNEGRGAGDDPDLAWVRMNAGPSAVVQIAFKRSLAGSSFMYSVIADGNLKNPGMLDYVDRFTEAEAGSPVKEKAYYPLRALFAVDNTCREAYGFKPNGNESLLCPREIPTPKPGQPSGCEDPANYTSQSSCEAAGCRWTQNTGVVVAVFYYCTYP